MKTFYVDRIRKYLLEQFDDSKRVATHEEAMRRFDNAILIAREREVLRHLIDFLDLDRKELDEYIEWKKPETPCP